jgi:hypothetical protein
MTTRGIESALVDRCGVTEAGLADAAAGYD